MNIEQENIELANRPVEWSLENIARQEVITIAHQIYDESLHARQSEINEAIVNEFDDPENGIKKKINSIEEGINDINESIDNIDERLTAAEDDIDNLEIRASSAESDIEQLRSDLNDISSQEYLRLFTVYQRTNSDSSAPEAPTGLEWAAGANELTIPQGSLWRNNPENASEQKKYL